MAKIRSIKPEAFTSLTLGQVERGIRWTFAGLWTECDDAGRMVWDPRLVKAALYPIDDIITAAVVADDVAQLQRIGAVHIYQIADKQYLHIPAWSEHSHPNRIYPSRLPACPSTHHDGAEQNLSSAQALPEQCADTAAAVSAQGPRISVGEGIGSGEVEVGDRSEPARQAEPPTPKPKLKSKRTTAPATFEITMDQRAWAKKVGFTGNHLVEVDQFLDYHRAKGTTALDWTAAWRTWIRNTVKWGATSPIKPKPKSGGDW